MAASDFNVKYVAHLARIQLSPEEDQKLGTQLGHILGFMEKLKMLDVSQVEPTAPKFEARRGQVGEGRMERDLLERSLACWVKESTR